MTTEVSDRELYYDAYDFEIDADPCPLWKRMRDEMPLYHNQKYDFYALSRYDDVHAALVDWETYRPGRGSVLELIRHEFEVPPGLILFEDPPLESQADYAVRAVRRMQRERVTAIEVRPSFERWWYRWLQSRMRGTSWTATRTYFTSPTGKIVTQWPSGNLVYRVVTKLLGRPSETASQRTARTGTLA